MVDSEAFKMNLAALRKVDSTISSIVDVANQVALYKFISEGNKWEKTEIEGTLFVYMRSQKPQHCFMVMNRLSTTNLVEPITNSLDFKDQTPFLLYRNGKGHIYGIWFYEEANCAKIFKLLTSLSQLTLTKNDSSSNLRQRSYSESNRKLQKQEKAQADILSLLTRAQDEYDKKSGSSKDPQQQSPNNDIVKPTPLRVNGAVTATSDATPLTLGMLFAQAGGVERKPEETSRDFDTRTRSFTASTSSELLNNSGKSTEAILQSLLSNSAHTVQHIERIQKEEDSKTDKNQTSSENRAVSAGERMLSAESVEKDLKEKLNILPKSGSEVVDRKAVSREKTSETLKSKPIDIPILTPAMIESFSSAPTGIVGSCLESFDVNSCNSYGTSFPPKKESLSFSPNQLLSPMDFTIPCRKKSLRTTPLPSSYSPELGTSLNDVLSHGNGNGHEDLLHPQSLLNGSAGANQLSSNGKPSVTPLNRDQLRESLIYMLQNDEDFVMQLHDCYVKRLKCQLNFVNKS